MTTALPTDPRAGRAPARPLTIPRDIPPAIVDTREQDPLALALPHVRGTLHTGDYSLCGLEACVTIERKSLSDLVGSLTWERERFQREIDRLLEYRVRAIVVEASMADALAHAYRSQAEPWAIVASTLALCARGVPVIWCGDRKTTARVVDWMLCYAWRRREELGLVPAEAAAEAA